MTTQGSTGRPRDPQLESRVYAAACRVYGDLGWRGFSVEGIARQAGVGKASIYLRWSGKADILIEALESHLQEPADIDTGTFRGDLHELARQFLRLYVGEFADAYLRFTFEGRVTLELLPLWRRSQEDLVTATRSMVQGAVERGELPDGTPVAVVTNAIYGGLLMHPLTTSEAAKAQLESEADDYAATVVDFVLGAITS